MLILSTSYLPPIAYFASINTNEDICIDKYEHYIKQTYRNRCYIYAANGKLCLSIPVIKTFGNHTAVKDIKIDNSLPWQKIHWRSIESAYNASPFFLYYRDFFESFYIKKYNFLIDWNNELLQLIFKLCKINSKMQFSENYIDVIEKSKDLRNSFSPKIKAKSIALFPTYTQVFDSKHGFINNLSIIDLLFNEGNYCAAYLAQIQKAKLL